MTKAMFGVRNYIINVLNGMAWGLFSSLLIGLIIKQLGTLLHYELLISIGSIAQKLMGPAIGIGVAYVLNAPSLVLISAATVGAIGAGSIQIGADSTTIVTGEPVGAFVAALIAVEIGRRIAGHTKVDIVLVPLVTIVSGGWAGIALAPYFSKMLVALGALINAATNLQPIPMGIVLAVSMGMILTLPISSAALAIALNLDGLAAGAATVGCCANMIGFAVISMRTNGIGGFIALGLGTSMLQVPNIIKNPWIWLPPIISSAILGPISTAILKMQSMALGAGMGTSGLVGQFAMLEVMGHSPLVIFEIVMMHFIAPGLISYIIYIFLKKHHFIDDNDLALTKIT